MFRERVLKKCLAESIVGVALTVGSPQKDVSLYSCPFESTTLPAQAWRRLFVELKVETYDRKYVPRMFGRIRVTGILSRPANHTLWYEGGGGCSLNSVSFLAHLRKKRHYTNSDLFVSGSVGVRDNGMSIFSKGGRTCRNVNLWQRIYKGFLTASLMPSENDDR